MMSLLLVALATYRLSYALVAENGPANVFMRWRSFVYSKVGHDHWFYDGVTCVLCLSFWLSWLVAMLLPWAGFRQYALHSLSAAAVCLIIHKVILWVSAT